MGELGDRCYKPRVMIKEASSIDAKGAAGGSQFSMSCDEFACQCYTGITVARHVHATAGLKSWSVHSVISAAWGGLHVLICLD
jgi:hypothetical protein